MENIRNNELSKSEINILKKKFGKNWTILSLISLVLEQYNYLIVYCFV